MTADTPSLPAVQECWGLFNPRGEFTGEVRLSDQDAGFWGGRRLSPGWTILPGRFVPDDAKEANHDPR